MKPEKLYLPQPASLQDQNVCNRQSFFLIRIAFLAVVFCLATAVASSGQSFTTVHSFIGDPSEGSAVYAPVIQATDGSLYGITMSGGSGSCTFGCGTFYKVTPAGALTTLYSFTSFQVPGTLIQGANGNFYGTSGIGGAFSAWCSEGCGSFFELTPGGSITTLYSFCVQMNCPDGGDPNVLLQGADGNLYGTTYYGGVSHNCSEGCGTVFKLTPAGSLTTLHSFDGADGSGPDVLIQASDGNFYGATVGGGAGNTSGLNGNGTVFKMTPGGALTTLYSFCAQSNCSDGGGPTRLILGTDGNLYGTVGSWGAHSGGAVFELTPDGVMTTLYSFCALKNCGDGKEPWGLIQASDGNLYGTTRYGGGPSVGTIFEILGGTLTKIHDFAPSAGGHPIVNVLETSSGTFYGTTIDGGVSTNCYGGCGTVFSFGPATGLLTSTSLSFGSLPLQQTSVPKAVALKNTGVGVLKITDVTISGNFGISVNTCKGAVLTSGKNCKVSLSFTPTVLGQQSGKLTFVDNSRNTQQTVSLSGNGIEPATLTPLSTLYARQQVGTSSAAKTFTLTNRETVPLSNITVTSSGDFGVSATTCTTSLAAKATCTISVTFTPTQAGTRTGQLSVGATALNNPQTATLKGTGY